MSMIIYRPVKWERNKDFRVTQTYWANFLYNWVRFYWGIVKARPYHLWIDYSWPKPWDKVDVYSWHDWVVSDAWYDSWRGNYVRIQQWEYETIYAHLDSIDVVTWEAVKAKQKLWVMWTTGNSTWVHLHLWLKQNWEWIDPTPFIKDWEVSVYPDESDILVEKWIWNWKLWFTEERRLTLLWKLYKSLE